jgi:hypothetical protein
MSDPSDDQRDELASAYLDGDATPAERAQVEADPALVRRVAELGVVRAALGAPGPSAGAETRDRAITAALATASPPAATVTPIDRHRSSRRALVVLGAAAAAVAVIAAVAVVATRSSNTGTSTSAGVSTTARAAGSTASFGPETQSAGAATSAAPTGGVSSTTVAASAAGRDASAAAATSAPPYLGVADDDSELRALLGATSASAVSPLPAPASAANSCTVPGATLVGTVTWQGTLAHVFVANGVATVIQVSDCRPIATVPLT